jgi:SAM-dependent methyltransferase
MDGEAPGTLTIDPSAGSPWNRPETVAGFTTSPPNAELMRFATEEIRRVPGNRVVDIGCGAGRNALPLAELGWVVVGIDFSLPMLLAAERGRRERLVSRFHVALAAMDRLPLPDGCADFVVAHGIWNLARSAAEFRRSIKEGARIAKRGAALFVFTFSRNTLAAEATPVSGEPFVFTQFSGQPQCFVTEEQLVAELGKAGFLPDEGVPLRELNRRRPGALRTGGVPVIYEGIFRYHG